MIKPYWEVRGELTLHGDLLLYGTRIIVPASMQRETLEKIHQGHQGIQRCRLRARTSVWWPGVSKAIDKLVQQCLHCTKNSAPWKEPLIPTTLPDFPWQKIGSDLFMLDIPHCSRLFLSISRSCEADHRDIAECHHSPKITLLKTWHPRRGSER